MDSETNNEGLIKILHNNIVLITLVPVIVGSGYLLGYMGALGNIAIQSISYSDIFAASLNAVFICAIIATATYFLHKMTMNIEVMVGVKRKYFVKLTIAAILILICISFIIYYSTTPGRRAEIYNLFMFSFVVIPSIYILLVDNIRREILYAVFILIAPFNSGLLEGRLVVEAPLFVDEVCVEQCHRVSIYAILSNYIVAISCEKKIVIYPVDQLRRISVSKRDADMLFSGVDQASCRPLQKE